MVGLRKPNIGSRARADSIAAVGAGAARLARKSQLADFAGGPLGEPEVAVWSRDDLLGARVGRGQRVLGGDDAGGCDAADLVRGRAPLGEPHGSVRSCCDPLGMRLLSRQRERRDLPVRSYPADLVALLLGELEVAVGAGRDRAGLCV